MGQLIYAFKVDKRRYLLPPQLGLVCSRSCSFVFCSYIYGGGGWWDKGGNFILFLMASSLFIDLSFSLQFFVQRASEVRAAGNLHSFISMHFFKAVLNIFPIVLTRRTGLTIKCILSWLSFSLSSCP